MLEKLKEKVKVLNLNEIPLMKNCHLLTKNNDLGEFENKFLELLNFPDVDHPNNYIGYKNCHLEDVGDRKMINILVGSSNIFINIQHNIVEDDIFLSFIEPNVNKRPYIIVNEEFIDKIKNKIKLEIQFNDWFLTQGKVNLN